MHRGKERLLGLVVVAFHRKNPTESQASYSMYALVMHAEYGQSSIASYFPAYSGALI